VFKGDTNWRKIKTVESETYRWKHELDPTFQNPPYFEGMKKTAGNRSSIVVDAPYSGDGFGDKITTDHISPARLRSKLTSPAGKISAGASGAAGRLQSIRHAAVAIMKS